jgi:transcriptional regulator with XRE-family HTH domain
MSLLEIGKAIKKARKLKKISQQDIQKALGISRSTISGIENGSINEIGVRKIIKICQYLGVELFVRERRDRPTLEDLLEESENE